VFTLLVIVLAVVVLGIVVRVLSHHADQELREAYKELRITEDKDERIDSIDP
jgi:hypothetical protein